MVPGADQIAGRPLSHILVLRGTGTSMYIAIWRERSESAGRGSGMSRAIGLARIRRSAFGTDTRIVRRNGDLYIFIFQ